MFLLLLMVSGSALAVSPKATSNFTGYNCASKLITEFQLDVPFKAEVKDLLNSAFFQKEQCAHLSAFLWQQLEQLSSIGQWSNRDASFRRHQFANVFLLSHFQAVRGDLTKGEKTSKMMYRIENVLKKDIFEEELFITADARTSSSTVANEFCAKKVHSLLQVKKPLSLSLAVYLNGLEDNVCKAFHDNLKLALTKMTNITGTSNWVNQDEAMKEITVQSVLRLLYICAKGSRAKKTDDVAFGLCDDVFATELLLDDIFSTDSGSNNSMVVNATSVVTGTEDVKATSTVWNVIFWATVFVTFLIALYLGLRFLEIIPGMA